MDAIAAASGVGKGTLFRAFGSRDRLLDSLWAAKFAALRERVESGAPPFEARSPAAARLVAFFDAILTFKLENRLLIRACEFGAGLLQTPHYVWMHGQARALLENVMGRTGAPEALYAAHALLAALHVDLVEDMLASGLSLETLRRLQAAQIEATIDGVRR